MKCPECGNPSRVYQAKNYDKKTIYKWRRRICQSGHRFSTYEKAIEPTK